MPPITIYTTSLCPYCAMAKRLLTQKGARFAEIDVGAKAALREEMRVKSGGRQTVPSAGV